MHDHTKECGEVKVLMGAVPSLREVRDISHNGLDLDKEEVKPKLPTTLVIHLNDHGFASTVANVQHSSPVEAVHIQVHDVL